MSGELQTIPARHGVATFVPRGRTIKIINTYGKQVVSTWAFSLHAPPEEKEGEDEEEIAEDIEEKTEAVKKEVEEDGNKQATTATEMPKEDAENAGESSKNEEEPGQPSKETENTEQEEEAKEEHEDPPEQAPDTPENEKSTEVAEENKQTEKRTWASYLPSMPYRSKGSSSSKDKKPSPDAQKEEKAKNAAASRAWSSYLPTGKGFSSYVPNVQIPDSKEVMSAFQASHYRDPNKSYAEQLYDFSKTPVGAGSIAAATGSGTASSLYAAYSAYTKMNPSKNDVPPMEYLSLPHTRASTHRLGPEVDDTLLTNLRSPIMTLIEDTTPGAHDTLTAACDASQYAALGVDKPEEHGSCAENLVLALKELNETAGLKGTKAVGADITVNIAPTPLHLFMNAPISIDTSAQSEGAGARGASLKVEEPKGKKRSYVRFRAERDIVIVMSACPMDVGYQNGGKCMAANFMVEEPSEEDLNNSTASVKKAKPRKLSQQPPAKKEEEQQEAPKQMPKPRGGPGKIQGVMRSAEQAKQRRDSAAQAAPTEPEKKEAPKEEEQGEASTKPKKKPKKLERRSTTPKGEAS